MGKGGLRALIALFVSLAMFATAVIPAGARPPASNGTNDTPTVSANPASLEEQLGEDAEGAALNADAAYVLTRTAGDNQLSVQQAAALRSAANNASKQLKKAPPSGPALYTGAWSAIGPNPISQIARSDNKPTAISGRIGALAIRKDGTFILGAAQGGIWTLGPTDSSWTNRTDNLPSLSTGALAVGQKDDKIVYDGTGEGALSGDSYFGNGILKSTDGGATWTHVSGDFFVGVSISRLAVDPTNDNHLYATVLRGRGGDKRVSPPIHSAYGIWESKDGGVSWKLLMPAPSVSLGATDIRIDPIHPSTLYASFWSDKIYKSTDGGATWNPAMNGLPTGNFLAGLTRFNLGLSHPASDAQATLYTGFDYFDTSGNYHPGQVYKSTDDAASWAATGTGSGDDSVLDYCGTQCFYDNVIETDPNNPKVVFAGGSFGYNLAPQSGGIFRSDDGGATWKNLGWDQHPDFHALAFDPNDSAGVLIGNDGGVWFSPDRGGRPNASDPLKSVDWIDLNGHGLQISQFSSIGANPNFPAMPATDTTPATAAGARIWYGAQDNGTGRKSALSNTWFDLASGDGGQVQVDSTDWHYVYGTYFAPPTSVYRFTDGGGATFSNQFIRGGINLNDRSDFYAPLVLNQNNTNQLFIGTFRLYRTDNAKAPKASDVHWNAISPDLTTGCTGAAPNGARNCTISAIGVGGGTAVYTGSLDGLVYFSPDAQISSHPTWTRVGVHGNAGNPHSLPNRPVAWIAVDRSNYRIAFVAFNGYSAATPKQPGHVFKTTNAGGSWQDISGNLPDVPVNSLLLDPSFGNTLYAATDVGPMVTYNGGAHWEPLGSGFPVVAVNQVDLDPTNGILVAGTHGRGGWRMDTTAHVPALVISKKDSGALVGAGSNLDYTLTLRNIGNGAATGVTITDPIPANTSFVSAGDGGSMAHGVATWSHLTVPASGSVDVHLRVRISPGLSSRVKSIVDDGFKATSAQGPGASGSPLSTPIAPAYGVTIAPATQKDGAKPGNTVTYSVTLHNIGINSDTYAMSATSGFPVTFYDSTCTTAASTTPTVASGLTTAVCVKVAIPANGTGTNSATITATSTGNASVSASAIVQTIAVTVATLLVDEDGNTPDVATFYSDALTAASVPFISWDLDADHSLSTQFMQSFKNIVWFTGNSYPNPITPYEPRLKAFLDNGGRLLMSGQDLLDQQGGTTTFVHDYLHITWDGSETQNDKPTNNVNGVAATLTAGVGTVPLDDSVLGDQFMDQITPINGAVGIFTDDSAKIDALSFAGPPEPYKVVFLAFPFEEYGSAAQKSDLITRVMTFFGP